jgi:hypothetical protein
MVSPPTRTIGDERSYESYISTSFVTTRVLAVSGKGVAASQRCSTSPRATSALISKVGVAQALCTNTRSPDGHDKSDPYLNSGMDIAPDSHQATDSVSL